MGEAKRRKLAVMNGPCACGSANPARDCCLDGNRWHKMPSSLGLRNLPKTKAVARCYMSSLHSCVSPISGEHLISESVIEVLQGDAGFSISGVPWLEKGQEKILSANNLRANCLCVKHNSALSPIDDAARYFFVSLKAFLEDDTGKPRHALVSGHDLEIWLLKTVKALAVSGNLASDNEKLSGAFSQDNSLIEMLDDAALWTEGAGLYCLMQEGDLMVNHSRFQLTPWTNQSDEIVGIQVSILGMIFVLLLEPFDAEKFPMLVTAKYRPARIEILYPKSCSWVTLSWQDELAHASLKIEHVQALPAVAG